MEIDKSTKPTYVNIVVDNSEKYINKLKDQADSDGQNEDDDIFKLSIREEGHNFVTDEIYFEEGQLHFSGKLNSKEGDTYICIDLPISQTVLFDILSESIKRFNKIKTVLEATK